MKLHRFFLNQPLGEDLVLKEKSLLHRIINVLKLEIEEKIIVFNDFQDFDFVYDIESYNKNQIILNYSLKKKKTHKDKGAYINLCFSMIKKDNFNIILEKCTEIGINEFTPMISDRTERKNIVNFNLDRSKLIITRAVEQSNQNIVPIINNPIKIRLFLEKIIKKEENSAIFVLDLEDFSNFSFINIKNSINFIRNPLKIYIFIGPEGGWTEKERLFFNENKLKTCSLGNTIFRAETSSILASWFFKNFLIL